MFLMRLPCEITALYASAFILYPFPMSSKPQNFFDYFFLNWSELGRTVLIGALAYVILVFLLRISGKRTLTKLNAFDLVVTVALGSTLASTIMSKTVALAEGATAFALLVLLQFVITLLSVKFKPFSHLVKAEPQLLLFDGEFMMDAMNRERVTRAEVCNAVRSGGTASLSKVHAVVLETDGSLSVIKVEGGTDNSALEGVSGWKSR